MLPNILEEILTHRKAQVVQRKKEVPVSRLKEEAGFSLQLRSFRSALQRGPRVSIITEVKRASPSRGVIRANFDPVAIARTYEENGADAISVLTEERFFQGKPEFLTAIKAATKIPVLCKDFIIDEYQLYESRALGADAVLLIVAALSDGQLKDFLNLAGELGLDCLAEVHERGELERALMAGAEVIGINNRDLKTFEVDLTKTFDLLSYVPEGKVVVSESGIRDLADILDLRKRGVDAVLIGEALMRADDIGEKLRELLGLTQVYSNP